MITKGIALSLSLLVLLTVPAQAQTQARYPTVTGNNYASGNVWLWLNPSGQAVPSSAANPAPVTCVSGCSSGGGSQSVTQGTSPWVVSGTVTANLGTLNGAATSALQTTINTTLGSPFQAGGSIGNTSFGISGTLPAFASPPTFNLGTLNGAALDSNVTTVNTNLGTINTSIGTTNTDIGPPGATACATDTSSCSLNALEQRIAQRLSSLITALGTPFQANGSIGNTTFAATAASGAFASGSIAAGAQVDLLTMRGTKAPGTAAANSMLGGGVYNATAPTLTDGQQASLQLGSRGGILIGGAGYPAGATPITASTTGTTGATTATLSTGASVTTYICGFSIRANATAAVTNNATVTGTITGTLNFTQWTAPNASGLGVTEMIFTPCIPASSTNTSIAVVSGAPGTGGVVSSTAWGYTL